MPIAPRDAADRIVRRLRMNSTNRKKKAEEILATAGIVVNGDRPWDMQVHDSHVYQRILMGGPVWTGGGLRSRLLGLRTTG